jgi:ABC-type antimicrobial peptide transport system permease subunit
MLGGLPDLVRTVDPNLAVEFAAPGLDAMAPAHFAVRASAAGASILSAVAVLLAMLGLYGVLSHTLSTRTREIGLRLALGAQKSRVQRMVMTEGMRPVLWGILAAFLVAGSARLMAGTVWVGREVSLGEQALALAATVVLLVAVGCLACALPAWRASRVDPNVALRDL